MLSKANFITINISEPANNYKETKSMDISKPCILILGGENTNSISVACSYFRSIKETLENNQIKNGLNLYSVYYDFNAGIIDRDSNKDRLCLFYKFRDPKQLTEMSGISQNELAISYPLYDTEPKYIDDIYKTALQPRFYAKNGQLLPTDQIIKNLRNMVIFAHCHGTYIVKMLEQKILKNPELQAILEKKPNLLKNLVTINHAPFAPLENCQFTTISFCSASDRQAGLYTEFDLRIKSAPSECSIGFLGPDFGNLVISNRLKHDINDEHSHIGLRGSDFSDAKLTKNGKILFTVERNALVKSVTAMIKEKPIPTIPQMLNTPHTNYEEMKHNGMQIYRHFMRTR